MKIRNTINSFKRKTLRQTRNLYFCFFEIRSLKIVEEKYLEAKKAFDITKSQLSQIEHRV